MNLQKFELDRFRLENENGRFERKTDEKGKVRSRYLVQRMNL